MKRSTLKQATAYINMAYKKDLLFMGFESKSVKIKKQFVQNPAAHRNYLGAE